MKLKHGSEMDAGIHVGTVNKIEARIQEWLETGYTPMAQYCAAHNGVIFLDGAQGKHNPDVNDQPLTVDSVFPVSSITKTFTATLAMMLTEDGLLAPTDRVYRHIPEFDGDKKDNVTIGHLMTHSAGIDDGDIWNMSEEEADKITISPENLARYPHLDKWFYAGCHIDNKRNPGEKMSYSSFSQRLVGEIIQRVTGKRLDVLMRERLFEPLGMTSTFLGVPESAYPRVVKFPKDAYFGFDERALKSISASGGAFSNARDLCVFSQMLLNKGEYNGVRVLSRLTVEAMTRNQIPGVSSYHETEGVFFKEAGWGYSFMISLDKFDETGTLRSPQTYGHSGAGCSMYIVDPVNNIVAVLMDCTMKHPGDSLYERRFDRFFNMVLSGVI